MLGAGFLWGPRQSLPASGWSGRRIAPASWTGLGGGGQSLSCPAWQPSLPCPALALSSPRLRHSGGASQEGDSYPPCQQRCHNRELSLQ